VSGLWRPAPRSAEAEAIYRAAEADRETRPERYALDPDRLAEAALAKAGGASGDETWREGFDVYVRSAGDDGRLNALGMRSMAGTAMGRLQGRFAIAKRLDAEPSIRARRIARPVFVIGGWRTGTTLLQRLLAALPALRAAYPAELTAPWRAAGLDAEGRKAFLHAGEAAHQYLHLLNPTLQAVHPSGGGLAEECVLAMGTDFRNWGFTSTLRCPAYVDWLKTQNMDESYRRYADILRLLQGEDATRWILKAPAHTGELQSLLAAFPDACVVQLHRDVVDTITSGASLFAVFRSTYSDEVDPAEVGRYQLDATARWFERAMAVRDALPASTPARFLDMPFAELVADPIAAARRICAAFDVDWSADADALLGARLADLNRQHGSHRYTPQQFGLDPDEIRERFRRYEDWL
jgi:LPS sulfotransferase NodH